MFASVSIPSAIITYVALLFSLCVHEASHATAAYLLDDDTAARMGRMTLNPMAHIDPIGTVVFPLMGLLFGGFFIGWAKPVPFNPARLTRRVQMKVGGALISMAGPASNVVLAVLFAILTALAVRVIAPGIPERLELFRAAMIGPEGLSELGAGTGTTVLLSLSAAMIRLNILLAAFNLIPLGPLDGAGVLGGFIPDHLQYKYNVLRYHQYTMIVLFGLMLLGALRFFLYPAFMVANFALNPLINLVLGV